MLASRRGVEAIHVGALPPQCAAVTSVNATVETMAVDAALAGDAERIYQGICNDPLTAAALDLRQIRKLVNELLKRNRRFLPHFKKIAL